MKKSRASRAGVCLVGIVMAGSGIVGCSVSEAASSLADYGNRNASGSTETEGQEIGPNGQLLPPGVKAPEEPAQPGAAKLGPDGHYDYSAPDFVLGDPCEDPELMSRLAEQGWVLSSTTPSRMKNPWLKGCTLLPIDSNQQPISLVAVPQNQPYYEKNQETYDLDAKTTSRVFEVIKRIDVQQGTCMSAIETSAGTIGIAYSYSDLSRYASDLTSCKFTNRIANEIFRSKK